MKRKKEIDKSELQMDFNEMTRFKMVSINDDFYNIKKIDTHKHTQASI